VQDSRARRYQADGSGLGWKEAFKREPGPHADAPFAVNFPAFEQMDETIVLPYGGEGFTVEGEDVDRQLAGRAFLRKSKIVGGVFTVHAVTRSLAPEFPAADAPAAAKALTDMANVTVYVRAPSSYLQTKQEVDALLNSSPTTSDDAVERGLALLHSGRNKEAVAAFDKAVTLNPKSSVALADRGLARLRDGDPAGAEADFKAARAVNPAEPIADQGEGELAMERADYAAAIASFSRAIERDPGDDYSRMRRIYAYYGSQDTDAALQAAADLLHREPGQRGIRSLRIGMLMAAGRRDEALAEADSAVAAEPNQAEAHTLRGGTLAALGRRPEAMAEFDRSIALDPTVEVYLTRLNYRDVHDYAGRLADVDAAMKLSPDASGLRLVRAEIEGQSGAIDKALADVNAEVAAKPEEVSPRMYRAAIYVQAHQPDRAAADFAWARGRAKTAQDWNALCWSQATSSAFLDQALTDCEAGLKLTPKAADILDSRAFVLVKLGRLDEAIEGYDAALKANPHEFNSLYGRGVAELRKGDAVKGRADLEAARAISAAVDNMFVVYGLTPP
jgi:tetratricopeptide (TPR) repeat protein